MRPDSEGYTILEVLIATALMGIMTVAITAVARYGLDSTSLAQLGASRDQVLLDVRKAAEDLRAVRTTMKQAENAALYGCVCGVGTCTNFKSPPQPVSLYEWTGRPEGRLLPSHYSKAGSPCAPAQADCLIRMQVEFVAQCKPDLSDPNPVPPATCVDTPAEVLAISYSVDQNPAVSVEASNRIRKVVGVVFHQVSDIAAQGGCP